MLGQILNPDSQGWVESTNEISKYRDGPNPAELYLWSSQIRHSFTVNAKTSSSIIWSLLTRVFLFELPALPSWTICIAQNNQKHKVTNSQRHKETENHPRPE
jgi:hypothetical protein